MQNEKFKNANGSLFIKFLNFAFENYSIILAEFLTDKN